MQGPVVKCPFHQKYQSQLICIETTCSEYRICCPDCIASEFHPSHKFMPIQKFYNILNQLNSFNKVNKQKLKERISTIKKNVLNELNTMGEMIENSFFCSELYNMDYPDKGEAQQISGSMEVICRDPVFKMMLDQKSKQQIEGFIEKNSTSIIEKIMVLEKQILATIKQTVDNIFNFSITAGNSKIYKPLTNNNKFSENLKPNIFDLKNNKTIVIRQQKCQKHLYGLSMYALVEQPLSQTQPKITFKLIKQGQRFVYVGVCDSKKFIQQKFMRGYQIGGGMIAIRQNQTKGLSAICLHDSDTHFSNEHIVGWDFQQGDYITLRLNTIKRIISIVKNSKQQFIMPLPSVNNVMWHPFVGLKYGGDAFQIVD